jgi:hypothetical protein
VVAFFILNNYTNKLHMTFKVLKPFYTHSNKQNYKVGQTIELTKEQSLGMLTDGYIQEVKEVKEVKETKSKK